MKILLDECLPRKLKDHLGEYDVFTVSEKDWASLKNGNLIKAAIEYIAPLLDKFREQILGFEKGKVYSI
jgi:hypothetical protein